MPPTSPPPPTLDLTFLRSRAAQKRMAVLVLACIAAGGLWALFGPRWYRSVLTIVPTKAQTGAGLSSLLGSDLGGLAASLAPGGSSADAVRIAAVLESNDVTDAVIAKFDLRARYREKYLETARDELWDHCSVKALPKPNLVRLTCEDKDPRFVQQMLEFFAEHGNQVFRRVSVSSASEEVRFLERRVAELRQLAEASSARMREFQEKHRIIDIESQSKAVVSALASLNSARISKQLELDYSRGFTSPDEASRRQLESQLSVMNQQLRELEGAAAQPVATPGKKARGAGSGVFPAALAVPKLRAEFETLFRERKVNEVSLILALERLESARADEARDTSTFLVLDPPALPTRYARPRPGQTLALAGVIGVVLALGVEWARGRRRARGQTSAPAAAEDRPTA